MAGYIIKDELNKNILNLKDAYIAVEGKGGTIPELKNGSNLPMAINSITGGGGGGESVFDRVIRTQEEFEELYNSTNWLGAKSVAFIGDGGTLEFIRNDNKGLLIPATVKNIVGFHNAKIKMSTTATSTNNTAIMYYSTKPAANSNHSISNINLIYETIVGSGITSVMGFYRCINIDNCSVTFVGTGVTVNMTGFNDCSPLYDCRANITNATNTGSTGFKNCSRIINAFANITGGYQVTVGFDTCSNLTNCSSTVTHSWTLGTSGYSYNNCSYLTNCIAYINGDNGQTGITSRGVIAFNNCSYLLNCDGIAYSHYTSNPFSAIFASCSYCSNCTGSGLSSGVIWKGTTNWRDSDSCKLTATDTGTRPTYDTLALTNLTNIENSVFKQKADEAGVGGGGGGGESVFDKIIKTQDEFDAMIADANWLGATRVAFIGDGGTLKFKRSDGLGILIPTTVKNIVGFNNAIIQIVDFAYTASNPAGLRRATLPTSTEYMIQNITLDMYQSIGLTTDTIGFLNCNCLINCSSISSSQIRRVHEAFKNCTNLINCLAKSAAGADASVYSSNSYGFSGCTYLTNCVSIPTQGGTIAGFYSCKHLSNCYCSSAISYFAHGFYDCEYLSNCVGEITISGKYNAYAFYTCKNLVNCSGFGRTTGGTGYIGVTFYNCSYTSNCKQGTQAPTTAIWSGTTLWRDDNSCQLTSSDNGQRPSFDSLALTNLTNISNSVFKQKAEDAGVGGGGSSSISIFNKIHEEEYEARSIYIPELEDKSEEEIKQFLLNKSLFIRSRYDADAGQIIFRINDIVEYNLSFLDIYGTDVTELPYHWVVSNEVYQLTFELYTAIVTKPMPIKIDYSQWDENNPLKDTYGTVSYNLIKQIIDDGTPFDFPTKLFSGSTEYEPEIIADIDINTGEQPDPMRFEQEMEEFYKQNILTIKMASHEFVGRGSKTLILRNTWSYQIVATGELFFIEGREGMDDSEFVTDFNGLWCPRFGVFQIIWNLDLNGWQVLSPYKWNQ